MLEVSTADGQLLEGTVALSALEVRRTAKLPHIFALLPRLLQISTLSVRVSVSYSKCAA